MKEEEFLKHFDKYMRYMKRLLTEDGYKRVMGTVFVNLADGICPFQRIIIKKEEFDSILLTYLFDSPIVGESYKEISNYYEQKKSKELRRKMVDILMKQLEPRATPISYLGSGTVELTGEITGQSMQDFNFNIPDDTPQPSPPKKKDTVKKKEKKPKVHARTGPLEISVCGRGKPPFQIDVRRVTCKRCRSILKSMKK